MLNMMMRANSSRARMRRANSNPDTVGRLMSITQTSGISGGEHTLAAFRIRGLQDYDFGVIGEQRAAPEATMG